MTIFIGTVIEVFNCLPRECCKQKKQVIIYLLFQRNRRDSNSRPPAWQAGALTKLSYDSNFILYIHIKEHFQRNRRDSNSRPPAWQAGALTKLSYDSNFQIYKWTQGESNSWPLECHSSALPSELWAQLVIHFLFQCSLKKRIQN